MVAASAGPARLGPLADDGSHRNGRRTSRVPVAPDHASDQRHQVAQDGTDHSSRFTTAATIDIKSIHWMRGLLSRRRRRWNLSVFFFVFTLEHKRIFKQRCFDLVRFWHDCLYVYHNVEPFKSIEDVLPDLQAYNHVGRM